jgi:hypothetical protein
MQQTFFQKVILTVIAGFAAACLIWGFEHVFEDANNAVGNYHRTSGPASQGR